MIFIVFVAKPDTTETKLESMAEIQEAEDEGESDAFATFNVSPLWDIVMGTQINNQFNIRQCNLSKKLLHLV